jgi:hypothetical protein
VLANSDVAKYRQAAWIGENYYNVLEQDKHAIRKFQDYFRIQISWIARRDGPSMNPDGIMHLAL